MVHESMLRAFKGHSGIGDPLEIIGCLPWDGLRGHVDVVDRCPWFRNLFPDFAHNVEVGTQRILKVAPRLFLSIARCNASEYIGRIR